MLDGSLCIHEQSTHSCCCCCCMAAGLSSSYRWTVSPSADGRFRPTISRTTSTRHLASAAPDTKLTYRAWLFGMNCCANFCAPGDRSDQLFTFFREELAGSLRQLLHHLCDPARCIQKS